MIVFCLRENQGTHAYYYQIQTQFFVYNLTIVDFCVCTYSTQTEGSTLYIVHRDDTFWKDYTTKCKLFFTTPEILGNWYTHPSLPINLTPPSLQSGKRNDGITLQYSGSNDPITHSTVEVTMLFLLEVYSSVIVMAQMIGCHNSDPHLLSQNKVSSRGKWYCLEIATVFERERQR